MAHLFAKGLCVAIAGAWLTGPVMGQTSAPTPTPAPIAAPPPGVRAPAEVERRIEFLRGKLKITPDETKAFNDFAQVMRDNAIRMNTLVKDTTKNLPAMTAVDHMKAYEGITQARADDMQRQVPAFSRLYEILTPAQKKVADDSFREAMSGRGPG